MNRLSQLLEQNNKNILSIYVTSGYPEINSMPKIIEALSQQKVDFLELGMPYSDPLADGPTIQNSSQVALKNGFTMQLYFKQVKEARIKTNMPFVYMGYLNQIMQYGAEKFCKTCEESGIDALIIPDLPLEVYHKEYEKLFNKYNLKTAFLITPQTSEARIKQVEKASTGFIYMVSQAATTGAKKDINQSQIQYFNRINAMKLSKPTFIGFGISDKKTFDTACKYANGAIIGSAFINAISKSANVNEQIQNFIISIKN